MSPLIQASFEISNFSILLHNELKQAFYVLQKKSWILMMFPMIALFPIILESKFSLEAYVRIVIIIFLTKNTVNSAVINAKLLITAGISLKL